MTITLKLQKLHYLKKDDISHTIPDDFTEKQMIFFINNDDE